MTEDSKKLVEELNRLYASGEMGVNSSEPHPSTTHAHTKAISNLDQDLLNQVETLLNSLRDHNIPFLLSLVVQTKEGKDGQEMTLSNFSWTPTQICEFVAAQVVLSLPHEFSHMVFDLANEVVIFKDFIKKLIDALKHDTNDN